MTEYTYSDFIKNEDQSEISKSARDSKLFTHNRTGESWFIKWVQHNKHGYVSALSQLIANDMMKYYLGDEYASTNTVIRDGTNNYIASRKIKNFKTLYNLGDVCKGKKIVNFENLFSSTENEPNNLGVIVEAERCIATKIDGDSTDIMGLLWHENKEVFYVLYERNQVFNDMYLEIKQSYYKEVRCRIKLTNEGKIVRFYHQDDIKELYLSEMDVTLRAKFDEQIKIHPKYVTLTHREAQVLGMTECADAYYQKADTISIDKLLEGYKKIININSDVFREIVENAVDKVHTYFGESYDLEGEKMYNAKEIKKIYLSMLEHNQRSMQLSYDILKIYKSIINCSNSHTLNKDMVNNLSELMNKTDLTNKITVQHHEIGIVERITARVQSAINSLFGKEKQEDIWVKVAKTAKMQLEAIKILEQRNYFRKKDIFMSPLQFQNIEQLKVLEKFLKLTTIYPQTSSPLETLKNLRNIVSTYMKIALKFDARGNYQGKDQYIDEFSGLCRPDENQVTYQSFRVEKVDRSLLDADGMIATTWGID